MRTAPHVLLVDDNELDRDMLSRRLARRGFVVATCADGHTALAAVRQDPPDLLLLDTGLPGLDGLSVARALKDEPDTAHLPILVVSAHALVGDREQALAAGCDAFVTKPVDLARLLDQIDTLLAARPERTLRLAPLTLEHLSEIRSFLAIALEELRGTPATEALQLAADEVCTNLVQHGAADAVRIALRCVDGIATLIIEDRGRPFAPEEAPAPNLTSDWRRRPVGGLGWFLTRRMVDGVQYVSLPATDGVRNRLTLTKRYGPVMSFAFPPR